MKQYLDLLRQTLLQGQRQKNRTGIDTLMIPGGMMQFELAEGFPILTTKRMPFKMIAGELCGFIRGYDSAQQFRGFGVSIWDANANENKDWLANPNRHGEDDLGRIYGKQWREWEVFKAVGVDSEGELYRCFKVDQLADAIHAVVHNPTSRRIVVSAWNPNDMNRMALPPCHYAWQLLVEQGRGALHMCMTMRSCDMFLGVPFNITSYALLLALIAKATGYEPGRLTMFLADVHIYVNHVNQVKEQLARRPKQLPTLKNRAPVGDDPLDYLEAINPTYLDLEGYDPHPPIKAQMAV